MKKKLSIFFIIVTLMTLCVVGFACKNSGITSVVANVEQLNVQLESTVNMAEYFKIEGKGKYNFVTEGDCLELRGTSIYAKKLGQGKVTLFNENFSASITIDVIDIYQATIQPLDTLVTYDGKSHNIDFAVDKGKKDDIKIEYFHNGQPFTGATEPGVYDIEVKATSEKYTIDLVTDNNDNKVKLTIDKIRLNIDTDVSFPSKTFVYDGTERAVELEYKHSLPESVKVSYTNNTAKNVGIYMAKAEFIVDTKYYYEILPKTARLTITSGYIDINEGGFVDREVTYDGEEHIISFDKNTVLPQGVSIAYFLEDTNTPLNNKKFSEVGEYKIIAKLTKGSDFDTNYVIPESFIAKLTIKKANFDLSRISWNFLGKNLDSNLTSIKTPYKVAGYSVGENNNLSLVGEKVCGVNDELNFSISYVTKELLNVGDYTIVGKISIAGDDESWKKNYNVPEDKKLTLVIEKVDYENINSVEFEDSDFDFTFDNTIHNFSLESFDTETFEVAYYYSLNSTIGKEIKVNGDSIPLRLADSYTIIAKLSFIDKDFGKNYKDILPIKQVVNISKLSIELPSLEFTSAKYTYDGELKTIQCTTTLPENVYLIYNTQGQVDVGEYSILATLYCFNQSLSKSNYIIKVDNEEKYNFNIPLSITKADYVFTEMQIEELTRDKEFVYNPTKTLADYPLSSGVYWVDDSITPTCDVESYEAYYNKDKKNYNNYPLNINAITKKLQLNASDFQLKTQFLPFTAKRITPSITSSIADINSLVKANCTADNNLVSIGAHTVNGVELVLVDKINYQLNNIPEDFDDFTIYIYDSSLYSYTGTILKKCFATNIANVLEGTTSIYNEAFLECDTVKKVVLPDSITALGSQSLKGLINLEELDIKFLGKSIGSKEALSSVFGIDSNSSLPTSLTKIIIREQTTIYKDSFANAKYIENIIFNTDIVEVEDGAFVNCEKLKSFDFSTAESIGDKVLVGCYNLENLSLPFIGKDKNTIATMEYLLGENSSNNSFSKYNLKTLTINGDITTLKNGTFKDLYCLNKITLPNDMADYGEFSFDNVKAEVNLNPNMTTINKNMFAGFRGKNLVIPSGVLKIESSAFSKAKIFGDLVIPNSVEIIEEYAFNECTASVKFAKDSIIDTLSSKSFFGYYGAGIQLPSSIVTLQDSVFENSLLQSITIPNTIKNVGNRVFYNNTLLDTAVINSAKIGNNMFYNCEKLASLSLGEDLLSIGDYAFYGCEKLTTITIPSKVTTIGKQAFYDCNNLTKVTLDGKSYLGDEAFSENKQIIIKEEHESYYKSNYSSRYRFLVV